MRRRGAVTVYPGMVGSPGEIMVIAQARFGEPGGYQGGGAGTVSHGRNPGELLEGRRGRTRMYEERQGHPGSDRLPRGTGRDRIAHPGSSRSARWH
jgi:hypothetical protein